MSETREGRVRRYFGQGGKYLKKDFTARLRALIVRDLLHSVTNCRIVDLGSGDGRVSMPLSLQKNEVSLVDSSPDMLKLARANAEKFPDANIHFNEGPIEDFSSDTPFNIVLCFGVLAHVSSVTKLLIRTAELTAPGGTTIIQFTDASTVIGKTTWLYSQFRGTSKSSYGYLLNAITKDQVIRVLSERGLRLVKTVRYSFLLPGMTRLPNELLYWLCLISLKWPFSTIGGECILVFER